MVQWRPISAAFLRLGSGQVLRLGSGQVLRLGSEQAYAFMPDFRGLSPSSEHVSTRLPRIRPPSWQPLSTLARSLLVGLQGKGQLESAMRIDLCVFYSVPGPSGRGRATLWASRVDVPVGRMSEASPSPYRVADGADARPEEDLRNSAAGLNG